MGEQRQQDGGSPADRKATVSDVATLLKYLGAGVTLLALVSTQIINYYRTERLVDAMPPETVDKVKSLTRSLPPEMVADLIQLNNSMTPEVVEQLRYVLTQVNPKAVAEWQRNQATAQANSEAANRKVDQFLCMVQKLFAGADDYQKLDCVK